MKKRLSTDAKKSRVVEATVAKSGRITVASKAMSRTATTISGQSKSIAVSSR